LADAAIVAASNKGFSMWSYLSFEYVQSAHLIPTAC
jgi:hypothetical protein